MGSLWGLFTKEIRRLLQNVNQLHHTVLTGAGFVWLQDFLDEESNVLIYSAGRKHFEEFWRMGEASVWN